MEMTLLFVAFFGTLLIMFVAMSFALRPSGEQKALQHRIVRIQAGAGDSLVQSDDLGNYLVSPDSDTFAWLEDLLQNSPISQSLQALLVQADSSRSVGTILAFTVGCAAAAMAGVYLATHILLAAGIAAVVGGYLPMGFLRFRAGSRLAKFNQVLPDSIDMMARSLRAGHSLAASLGIIADQSAEPVKSEFAEVFKKLNYGLPMRDSFMTMLERIPSQDLRVFMTALLVQKDTGGNLVDILDRTVTVIRERMRIKREIQTHTAQGRMTGWILCALPVVMIGIINIVNPGYSSILFTDPLGQKMLGAGVVLLILGGLVIRAIINSIEI